MDKKESKKKQGIPRLLEISGERPGILFGSILLSVLGTLCQLVPYISVYRIMSELLCRAVDGQSPDTSFLIRQAMAGLWGMAGGYLLCYAGGMLTHTFAYRVICGVRLKTAEYIGRLPLGYLNSSSVGKVKQILEGDAEQIEAFLAHQLPDFVSTLVMLLAMFIIMFRCHALLAAVCLFPVIAGFVCQFAVLIKIMKSGGVKKNFDALERISSSALQYVNGMPSIKIFGQTVRSFRSFYDDIIRYRDFTGSMTEMIRPGFVGFRMFVLSVATFLVPVGLLIYLKDPDSISFVAAFIFFLVVGPAVTAPVLKLRNFSENMNVITEGVNRLDAVLDEKAVSEPEHSAMVSGYDITFENVSFSYDGKQQTLHDVSFTAAQGTVLALVGPSGAGKSTIAELIPRFYDVNSGSVKIGGTDIREFSVDDLMEQMAFVFQESFLFADTVYQNIALGRPNTTKEDVIAAAKAAQCHDFIMQLPQGYDTKLGEGSVYLSGGEKQRVSIARAILKNAPILILDEASAYADAENEYALQQALAALAKDKTVIMIAHRLATIQNAAQILVVENGTISERGTHEQLLKQHGKYAEMWQAMSSATDWQLTK